MSHCWTSVCTSRLALLVLAVTAVVPEASAQGARSQMPFPSMIPADRAVAQVIVSTDTARAYVVTPDGELWVHDRSHASTRLATARVWDLSLAATGVAIAFARGGVKATDRTVWLLPLDPRTGRASGTERRISSEQGDVPAISPDGLLVAYASDDSSGVGQSVTVVPVAGGRPRVILRSVANGIATIRWTPDGKSLFVGTNPPVPCIPDWSCLPLRNAASQPRGAILRVAATGGVATPVLSTPVAFPGLSPDGSVVIVGDTGRSRSMVIAAPDGRRLQPLVLGNGETVQGWVGSSGLLLSATQTRWRVERYGLGDHARTTLADGGDAVNDAAMSPDGTMASLVICSGSGCHVRIVGADGAIRRDIELAEAWSSGDSWSPDQRAVAIVTRGSGSTQHLAVVDPASGRLTTLGDLASTARVALAWLPDSRGLIVAIPHNVGGNNWRTQFTTFDLTGHRRDLRDLAAGPGNGGALPLDTATALVFRTVPPPPPPAGAAPVATLPSMVFARVALSTGEESPLPLPAAYYYAPAISADHRWITMRTIHDPSSDVGIFEVLRVDGSGQHTVTVSFMPSYGDDNPALFPGGDRMILRGTAAGTRDATVYMVDVVSSRATPLFSVPSSARIARLSLAANGSALLFLTAESAAPRLSVLDVAQLLSATRH